MKCMSDFGVEVNQKAERFFEGRLTRLGQIYSVLSTVFAFFSQATVGYLSCLLNSSEYLRRPVLQKCRNDGNILWLVGSRRKQ